MTDFTPGDVKRGILETGVMAIVRLGAEQDPFDFAAALIDGGVRALEFTLDNPRSLESVSRARAHYPNAFVGAGTVTSVEDVAAAASAGAQFCVSADTNPAVIEACVSAGLLPIPGALTATEVNIAVRAGASLIKLFPAMPLGASYLRALRGPLSHVDFMPTGGVDIEHIPQLRAAGAVAFGLGSCLVTAGMSAAEVTVQARRAIAAARGELG